MALTENPKKPSSQSQVPMPNICIISYLFVSWMHEQCVEFERRYKDNAVAATNELRRNTFWPKIKIYSVNASILKWKWGKYTNMDASSLCGK